MSGTTDIARVEPPRRSKGAVAVARVRRLLLACLVAPPCGLVAVGAGIAFIGLWRVPSLAARHGVAPFDLVLRVLDGHERDPFLILGGREHWRDHWVRVDDAPRRRSRPDEVVTRRMGEHAHELIFSYGSDRAIVVRTTTPHTCIPAEQLAAARVALTEVFRSDGDAGEADLSLQSELARWGNALFSRWWRDGKGVVDGDLSFPEMAVVATEDEKLWFAWQQLKADMPDAERDLRRLAALAREAFPDPDDHRAGMTWAATLHQRLQRNYRNRKIEPRGVRSADDEEQDAVAPPAAETTYHWLLYQYVGLDRTSREQVRRRWLGCFPTCREEAVLDWGRALEAERRAAGEPLPRSRGGDDVALLCAIERLVGTDLYGVRVREARDEGFAGASWGMLEKTARTCYPSDDLFYLLASADPLGLHTYDPERFRGNRSRAIIATITCLGMIWYGLHVLVFGLLGNRWLKLGHDPRYLAFRDRRSARSPLDRWLTLVVVPLVTFALAWVTLPQQIAALVTPWELLLGVSLSLWLGGTVLTALARIASLLLIRLGVDVERGWWDEIAGLSAGVWVLRHFDNDWLSIAAFVLLALLPELLLRRVRQPRFA